MFDSEGGPTLGLDDIFTEPPRPPSPEPTVTLYTRDAELPPWASSGCPWSTIEIRLVGSHPLWGHYLWNASRAFASYLDIHSELYRDRSVLELGAGGGLPGLVAAKNGARTVVLTDYPDTALLENLAYNVQNNVPSELLQRVHVKGYIWGHSVDPLLNWREGPSRSEGFDLIIMSDLIFNHSQHNALLQTCEHALSRSRSSVTPDTPSALHTHTPPDAAKKTNKTLEPCLLVFYTHHRPHLAHRDMQFFDEARDRGWLCNEILTQKFEPMFPEDPGEEEVRATVHGWRLTRTLQA
ncbi:Protein N-terminal and lysine N-methyltransferase EFM7 [Sparassis crispa]|uniref:Protein N-terminal and lysine N-methyltransferase EFM7 n=1 Tax=Sparassis crispa TaxID=139825 RepID=A0A401GZI4_9APHY|nr:Protein N-terminal and lysine N-methyltransferase EFM7 [Sparassis crispa]GBE87585.1 Protein N-terminal and lysine N-methyltransferase EFM7 [Sparassis crispa]